MKINFLVTALYKSGGMKIIFEYANKLKAKGYDVLLYYPMLPYKLDNSKGIRNVVDRYRWRCYYFRNQKKYLENFYPHIFEIKLVPRLINLFIKDADIVIATEWPTSYSVDRLSSNKGRKFYFVLGFEKWDADMGKVLKSYTLNLKMITTSTYLRHLIYDYTGTDSKVILNGIDYDKYYNDNKIYNQVNKNILFINYELESKGTNISIEVLNKIKNKYPNVIINCFGLKKYHNLPEYINFFENPSESDIIKLYCASDIFLFTSLEEGFALPPAEAMACKCAVVTTKVGAIPEYSIHKESAIYIKPNDVEDPYNAISYLLDNENEIIRISENAYNFVRGKLNWDISMNEFEKILMNL